MLYHVILNLKVLATSTSRSQLQLSRDIFMMSSPEIVRIVQIEHYYVLQPVNRERSSAASLRNHIDWRNGHLILEVVVSPGSRPNRSVYTLPSWHLVPIVDKVDHDSKELT